MKIIQGSKIIDITEAEIRESARKYHKTVVDFGTGDGRLPYKNAKNDSNALFIGVDPNAKQMMVYSKKCLKEKVENVMYIVGSIEEHLSLQNIADEVNIIFPWGTLLKSVVLVEENNLANIKHLLKSKARINIIFGYDKEFEPTEYERLDLQEINIEEIKTKLEKFFETKDIKVTTLDRKDLSNIESSWGKKLRFNPYRKIYKITIQLV